MNNRKKNTVTAYFPGGIGKVEISHQRAEQIKRLQNIIRERDEKEEKPLFIPLKQEYYEQFEAGTKTKEFRRYGNRWNYRTCTPGREAILSCGYGKKRRLSGVIKSFKTTKPENCDAKEDFFKIYGNDDNCLVAEIEIKINK